VSTRVLVIANRTAATPRLLDEVRSRAERDPCAFTLLIPDVTDRRAADWTLQNALLLLSKAAGGPVDSLVGGPEPFEAIKDAVGTGRYDEILISTKPARTSKWLRRDLVRKVEGLGLPVTAIVPQKRKVTADDVDFIGTG